MAFRVRLAANLRAFLDSLPPPVRYEVETQLKTLAQLPDTGAPLDFPYAGGKHWTFVVPTAEGDRAFSVIHIPDRDRQVVDVVGLGELAPP